MAADRPNEDRDLKVLALEDSARDFELISERLTDAGYRFAIERVETEEGFAAALRGGSWDVILADFKLPGFDAFAALRIRNEICPVTPFICVSGFIGEETAIDLLKSGAVDNVLKGRLERLPMAVGRALDEVREKKRRTQSEEDLRKAYRQLLESQNVTLRVMEDLKQEIQSRESREAELRKVTMAVEQAAETVLITDPEGTIQYVNPAFTAVSGYSRDEVMGQNPRVLKSGQHDRAFYQKLWATITDGRIWKDRLVNRRKDGTFYTEEATISAVKDASGGILSYVAVKRDITEFLRAEEERTKLQEAFQQAQKMESVGRLAGGVAHDFNNLLTVINGYADMLLGTLDSRDPLHESLSEIRVAGARAADLTQQLLAFSRRQVVEFRVLDVNQVVRDVEKMLRRVVGEDIELTTILDPELGRITGDKGQLTQVLMNLVVNARDAMPHGGRLQIETRNVTFDERVLGAHQEIEPGSYVQLAISDSGFGMDIATKARMFEPFFTTKRTGEGTGLGLSTVYGIVTQTGGSMDVESEVGRGTTFKIYFPPAEENGLAEEPKDDIETLGGRETILLVEDQANLRKLAELVLKSYGYRVLETASGGEALLMAEGYPGRIQLLLTDVVMPGMNGRQLAERLKQLRADLKVLYMSGYTEDVIAQSGVLDEGVEYLAKPFTPEGLARKVRKVLGPPLPAETILVVDDAPAIRGLLRKVLEGAGYEVLEAEDGKQATALAAKMNLDLVITDLVMPEQEGLETIEVLHRQKPGLQVLAISGAFEGQFLKIAQLLGAKATLTKPIRPDELLKKVREALLKT